MSLGKLSRYALAAIVSAIGGFGGGVTPPSNGLLTEFTNVPPLDEILTESGLPLLTDP